MDPKNTFLLKQLEKLQRETVLSKKEHIMYSCIKAHKEMVKNVNGASKVYREKMELLLNEMDDGTETRKYQKDKSTIFSNSDESLEFVMDYLTGLNQKIIHINTKKNAIYTMNTGIEAFLKLREKEQFIEQNDWCTKENSRIDVTAVYLSVFEAKVYPESYSAMEWAKPLMIEKVTLQKNEIFKELCLGVDYVAGNDFDTTTAAGLHVSVAMFRKNWIPVVGKYCTYDAKPFATFLAKTGKAAEKKLHLEMGERNQMRKDRYEGKQRRDEGPCNAGCALM